VRYQEDLQVKLRERLRRLVTQDYTQVSHEVRLIVDWINRQPALRAVLAEAALVEPDLDFEAFEQGLRGGQRLSWTSQSEEGRAVLAWKLMQHIADEERAGHGDDAIDPYLFAFNGNLNDQTRELAERVFAPLFNFLGERIGAESSVLYVLERYVRRVEWFDRDELHRRYREAVAAGHVGEDVYNLDLQRFLFIEGDYITYAKPRSASGEADVIGELDTDDPLVCDGKIFDGDGRGKSYLAKGFNQIIQYAQDHQKNVAYLVVFNITGRPLQFPTDGTPGTPSPYIEMSGIRVYLVAVRALPPQATASKLGKAFPFTLTRDDLVNPDAA
jgi:hypothetical protein